MKVNFEWFKMDEDEKRVYLIRSFIKRFIKLIFNTVLALKI